MERKYIKYIICFLLLWTGGSCSLTASEYVAGTDSLPGYEWRTPGDDFLQQFRDDEAFQYKTRLQEPGWWQKIIEWLSRYLSPGQQKEEAGQGQWWEIIAWIVVIVLLVFLLYRFILFLYSLRGRAEERPFAADDDIGFRPVGLESYRQLTEKALADTDYSLAIRLHYLYILHLLDEKGFIRWDAHKTNQIYISELEDERLKKMFGGLCRMFEYVCYGDIQVDEPDYRRIDLYFTQFEEEVAK